MGKKFEKVGTYSTLITCHSTWPQSNCMSETGGTIL
jgi:hypothetical protein